MPTRDSGGVSVKRMFTVDDVNPLDSVHYDKRNAEIKGTEGVVFSMEGIQVPATWSQLATDIVVSKYFRKAGVPETGHEVSVRQLVARVAGAIKASGLAQGYFGPAGASVFVDELTYLLLTQRAAFNSPVWFNVGLKESYGINSRPAGNWYWNQATKSVEETDDGYTHPQASACFIQKIDDDLMDIADHVKREMRIFKYGSGAGANFSSLRARGESLSNGGSSSGMLSFLEVFDRAAGAIKSGGTTRRAAKMVVVDADHPDVEEFINWKVREEDKIRALIGAGYSAGLNGEAARTVGGQNANNSVRVTDEFMQAVMDDGDWSTKWRITGEVATTIKAKSLMRKIADAAWKCADPGLQFDTTCNRWHTCPETGRINGSNPCSEFMFIDNSACNLASMNLVKFLRADGSFNCEEFSHACRVVFLAQEILVDYASYPTKEIAQNSHDYRPLGIGYANLGAMLMRLGLPYDSDEGRHLAASVTALMTGVAYDTSADIAYVMGPFPVFKRNKEPMLRVMRQHQARLGKSDVYAHAKKVWAKALSKGMKSGYRNAQASLLAPTGTISFLMDCDTTGIEPDYALVKEKKLAGGGKLKLVNQSVGPALAGLGYPVMAVRDVLDHLKEHEQLENAPHILEEHLPVFDCASRCGDGARFISPMGHVRMMQAVQPFLSGAISKTVNMPHESTVDDIEALYVDAWRMGLKSIAVYRADSKACQVLGRNGDDGVPIQHTRRRLPKQRKGFTQEAKVGGQKVYVRTGEYEDGSLGEIFIDMHKEGATMRSITNCFAIAISLGLQHGVPLAEFVDAFTFTNFAPNGIVAFHPNIKFASSVVDYLFRLLAVEYLERYDLAQVKPDDSGALTEQPTGEPVADSRACTTCGMLATRKGGTCYVCGNCGTQTGCA